MMNKFYDTSSLLLYSKKLNGENFTISSITIKELETIKSAYNKDNDIKQQARELLNYLDENTGTYTVWIYNESMLEPIKNADLEIANDTKILATAIDYERRYCPDNMLFITNDIALKNIANLFFGNDSIWSIPREEEDDYTGYQDITMSEEEMAAFYSHPTENLYGLETNEYLIVRDSNQVIVDTLCWTGEEYRKLNYNTFESSFFGKVKPFKDDIYQAIFADSLMNNTITLVKGPAGSGKSYLSLAYLLSELEHNRIDRIIIFCNTLATKNSAKLGYYPGSREEKLLDSQIGNFLVSKIGSKTMVEEMIADETLILLPLSDVRGYDTSGLRAGVYITEAQNMDIGLMKLTLQRIGEDSICIIDGDCRSQVDLVAFEGDQNGMKRVSKVFRGEDIYGEVELRKIHRSKLAQIAEKL